MSKLSIICLFVLLGISLCAEQKIEAREFPKEDQTGEQAGQGQPQGENINMGSQDQKQAQEEMRQVVISCILFTKHYFHNNQKALSDVLDFHGKESNIHAPLYKKMFSSLLELCYQHLSFQESQKFFEDIQKQEFSIAPYEHLAEGFDWNTYAKKDVDTVLNPMQQSLYKNAEDFDRMIKDRQKEQGMDEEEEPTFERKPEDYEPKVLGVSLKSSPAYLKLAYLLTIVGFFAALIALGFKMITPKDVPPKKKSKKAKNN